MLVCIVGRSGSGKTTMSRLLKDRENFKEIVSYTTRKKRAGEVDGIDYNFVGSNEFTQLYKDGDILEYSLYDSNYYGTPMHDYTKEDWVNVVDIAGVKNLKRAMEGKGTIVTIGLVVNRTTSFNRCNERDTFKHIHKLSSRVKKDDVIFEDMSMVDHLVDAEQSIEEVYGEIEKIIHRARELEESGDM